jgi:hypothetical protein
MILITYEKFSLHSCFYLNVVGNKSMITVKTTLVATLADAINKDDKDTTIAELVEKYMEQAHNPEMMPKISEKNCVV